jgi:hypothetical protein
VERGAVAAPVRRRAGGRCRRAALLAAVALAACTRQEVPDVTVNEALEQLEAAMADVADHLAPGEEFFRSGSFDANGNPDPLAPCTDAAGAASDELFRATIDMDVVLERDGAALVDEADDYLQAKGFETRRRDDGILMEVEAINGDELYIAVGWSPSQRRLRLLGTTLCLPRA